jgi:thiamine biosynthesis protein ThiI
LYTVPFGELQQRVVISVPPPLRVVLYRRLMMRIAERLAHVSGAKALVSGESVGQVASQTLENLSVINEVVSLPVLRPLIGYDKEEITREAKRLGSYPISIIPDEDCCTLFTPKHPATKARREDVERAESALPIADMVEKVLALTERQDYEFPA